MKTRTTILTLLTICLLSLNLLNAQTNDVTKPIDSLKIANNEKLVVLWTSGDRDVAIKMVFMYTYNAKKYGWWDDITFIVWGPSAKLITEDADLQEYLAEMLKEGIVAKACKACSDQYGVSEKLEELGIIVKYMGVELTDYIKEGRHVLTF
ncbi:DsrE family protein [bacterium]|nr:DsrE family protein [bacterium]